MSSRSSIAFVVLLLAHGASGCEERVIPTEPTRPATSAGPSIVPLLVMSVVPNRGFVGTGVQISGAGFSAGASVNLGDAATNVRVTSGNSILATTPATGRGMVDVVVTNANGESAALVGGFFFEDVTLAVTATTVATGSRLSVSWSGTRGHESDWIGLFKVGTPSEDYQEGLWEYTGGLRAGTMTFTVPPNPGQYEFRYLLEDGYVEVARSEHVTVR